MNALLAAMKKRGIVLSAATIIFILIIAALVQFGYFEYFWDSRKIDSANNDYSVVVTLSIGPDALIIKPYYTIIQIKSDKTITENTFRAIRWKYNPLRINRTYDDKIIKGQTRTLSDEEYNNLFNILENSDFEEIQREINGTPWFDGNDTYITIKNDNGLTIVGGPCAENTDHRFKCIMDCIIGLLE